MYDYNLRLPGLNKRRSSDEGELASSSPHRVTVTAGPTRPILEVSCTIRPIPLFHQVRVCPAFSSWHQLIFQTVSNHAFYSVTTFLSLTSQDEHFFFPDCKKSNYATSFQGKNLQWQPDPKHHLYAKRVKLLEKYPCQLTVVSLNTELNLKQK